MSKHSSDNESIATESTKITKKDSPIEEYNYNKHKELKIGLKSLKENIFQSKGKENVNSQNLDKVSNIETIYNFLVDNDFNGLRKSLSAITSLKGVDINESDVDVLKSIAMVIKKNNYSVLSESYPRDIDIFETITNKLDLMGEDTSDLYDVYW